MSGDASYCKIHPAIGIARVGNSPSEYFIGPEIPDREPAPVGGFKDRGDASQGIPPRVKRQGARFRIFAYDDKDKVIGEVTGDHAEIIWTVHLANSKAEGDRFAGVVGEDLPIGERRPREFWRNRDISDRASLFIDPGARTLRGPSQSAEFDGGEFRGLPVPLGKIQTDAASRLIVLGGFGKSGSSNPAAKIRNYAEWDDIRTAPRQHMQIAFQQKRKSIVGECRQLKTDMDSYNDAHTNAEPIQISFDFNMDLAELEAAMA